MTHDDHDRTPAPDPTGAVPDLDTLLRQVGSRSAPSVPPVVEEAARDLLGGSLDLDRRAISREVGLSVRTAERFWHALGLPRVGADESAFASADLDAIRSVAELVRQERFDERTALALTRACARTADRLAAWHTSILAESLSPWLQGEVDLSPAVLDQGHDSTRAEPDAVTAHSVADGIGRLADELEPLVVYAWRRHLASAVARMVADASPELGVRAGRTRGVGFADLVAFTSLVRRLSERELAVLVQRFENIATDVITAGGGRVVKTVGDEVFFVAEEPARVARIALDLLRVIEVDDLLPPARVGLAFGPIVSRLGDVFGTAVNKAARLTAVAPTGRILVDDVLAGLVADEPDLAVVAQRARTLRGVGVVVPHLLQPAPSAPPSAQTPPGLVPDRTPEPEHHPDRQETLS